MIAQVDAIFARGHDADSIVALPHEHIGASPPPDASGSFAP